jgi:transcriptional regulator with PAS, ATPase and Fis domain
MMNKNTPGKIIGHSPCMMELLDIVNTIAPKDVRIIVRGERGTGKELIADAIYSQSLRNRMPFVKLNCAVLTRDLLASELFGHVKGSFTGATDTRNGLIMAADGGTLFLDEVADLSLESQAAILRFLQEGEIRPVGSLQTFKVNARIISATNKNLEEAMEKGTFREDLYDRLNGFSLIIPPLRERHEDIPDLVNHFLEKYNQKYNESVTGISRDTMTRLMTHPWRGNIRELENVISRAVILARGRKRIGLEEIQSVSIVSKPPTLLNVKQETILSIIREKGRVTAKSIFPLLGISDRAVRKHLQHLVKLGLVKMEGNKKNTSYTIVLYLNVFLLSLLSNMDWLPIDTISDLCSFLPSNFYS